MSPEFIIQKQLEAYNKRDIHAFIALFDENCQIHRFGEQAPFLTGKGQIREFYQELFDRSPQLYSKIITRTVIGNKVIDHELISGRKGSSEAIELVMIYVVENDLILSATSISR